MRVLFLAPYPFGKAGSQRFRFEHYFRFQEEWGHTFDFQPFIDDHAWMVLYKKGFIFKKIIGFLRGVFRRIRMLFRLKNYDLIFIHREAMPIGPPIIEWMIANVYGKRYVFDFDDAIWLPNTSEYNKFAGKLKWHHKTGLICKWAWKVSVGNAFLADYARQFNSNVQVMPTVVDTEMEHNIQHSFDFTNPIIGWTGTHSTISYLENFIPVLRKVYSTTSFRLLVISDKQPVFTFPDMEYISWNKATEIADLNRMDIGIMPLEDNDWSRGKCGFKAIQYMSLGIPALVSPVGVNKEIVIQGENGFICGTEEEWEDRLISLLKEPQQLAVIGIKAKNHIHCNYSVFATKDTFNDLLK